MSSKTGEVLALGEEEELTSLRSLESLQRYNPHGIHPDVLVTTFQGLMFSQPGL